MTERTDDHISEECIKLRRQTAMDHESGSTSTYVHLKMLLSNVPFRITCLPLDPTVVIWILWSEFLALLFENFLDMCLQKTPSEGRQAQMSPMDTSATLFTGQP